jgi:class 3 adenylate cyclase
VGNAPGDRRQITVAFCDLVDSTVLAERLDPEELRDVVGSYQAACAHVIERWEGHIAQFLGDGILVYFGYPIAHEDDPLRAIRAGLEIAQAVTQLRPTSLEAHGLTLAVRVGIHTGLVVTGEIGVGARKEVLAVGSTPNVGARLQSLAPANAVVVSTETLRLTEGFFKFEVVPTRIRAGTQLVSGFRVLEPNPTQTRFELAVEQGLTPLQGRENESAALESLWTGVRAGHGAIVSVRGEPGIGKSRLLHQFRELRDAEVDVAWLLGRCSPFARDSAFAPLTAPLRQLLTELPRTSPETSAPGPDDLSNAEPDPRLAVLAPMLGLPLSPESRMSPELARRAAIECAFEDLFELARTRAIVLCLEDLHWADPSTLEVLDELSTRIAALPILIFVTARPEFEHAWPEPAAVQQIAVGPLSAQAIQAIVTHVAQGVALPGGVVEAIVARTDGVPLFVEELTKAVLEHTAASRPSTGPAARAEISIPTTLQDSLMARLDRLSEGKRVAQLGAVLGREFSHELLGALELLPEVVISAGIQQLAAADLLSRSQPGGGRTYAFKHALIQDAAYASLLRGDRRRYHGRIADVLGTQFQDVAKRQPELLAHHLIEAGRAADAIDPSLAAAQSSLERGATTEAKHHLERARTGAAAILDERKRWERELQIEMVFAQAARAASGYASQEVENAYSSALELSERLAATSGAEISTQMLLARLQCGQDFHAKQLERDAAGANRMFWILWGFGAYHQSRAELHKAFDIGQQLIQLAGDRPALALEGHFGSGSTAYFLGRMPDAEQHLRAGWRCFETLDRRAETSPTGHHAEVLCAGYLCLALWHLGFCEEADAQAARALAAARAAEHAYSVAYALTMAAWLEYLKRDLDGAEKQATAALEHARRYQFGFPIAWATPVSLWVDGMRGSRSAATQLKAHIEDYRRSGQRLGTTFFQAMLAELLMGSRDYGQASAVLVQAQAAAEDTDERFWQPELYRLQAEVQLRISPTHAVAAKQALDASVRLARRQGARSLESRSAKGLAATEIGAAVQQQPSVVKGIQD